MKSKFKHFDKPRKFISHYWYLVELGGFFMRGWGENTSYDLFSKTRRQMFWFYVIFEWLSRYFETPFLFFIIFFIFRVSCLLQTTQNIETKKRWRFSGYNGFNNPLMVRKVNFVLDFDLWDVCWEEAKYREMFLVGYFRILLLLYTLGGRVRTSGA